MNTKSATSVQAQAQDVVFDPVAFMEAITKLVWKPMTSAPVGDASACIDIWCGEDDCRRADCFWEPETQRWVYEDFESGAYRTRGVKAPIAWMAAPVKPEVV